MTKLPRGLSAEQLLNRLQRLGYQVLRQRGSHITLYTPEHGRHRVWLPRHNPVAPGTLRTILGGIAAHFKLSLPELLDKLGL